MAKLAGVQTDPLSENISETQAEPTKEEKENIEIISENKVVLTEMPLFGDDEHEEDDILGTPEILKEPIGELSKDLKAAMVLNNVNQYQAVMMGLYTKYNPKTILHKPEAEQGTKGTIYTKYPVNKLAGASAEISRLSKGGKELTYDEIQKLNAAGVSDEEISAAIELQRKSNLPKKNLPVTWGEDPNSKKGMTNISSKAKWDLKHKTFAIISYKNGTLTNTGKQQLEFLSRMLSGRPLPQNGDENVDIEQTLFNSEYKSLIVENAEFIIRTFYNRALIVPLSQKLKRNNASPQDSQFGMLKMAGIDKSVDMTKEGKYNASGRFQNYNAWFMKTALNAAIDKLKPITDYKFDIKHVSEMLSSYGGPFEVESSLNPKDAYGNYDSVRKNEKGPYYTYIYNEPLTAISDFQAGFEETEEGNKFSPLASDYVKDKGDFYVSTLKDVPDSLSQTVVQPSFDEKINVVPINDVLKFADKKVDEVLNNIAGQMTLDKHNGAGKVPFGETVKLTRPKSKPMSIDFYTGEILDMPVSTYDYHDNFTSKKEYEVLDKKSARPKTGGPDANYYKILDDNGKEFWVRADSFTSSKKMDTTVVAKLRDSKDATKEILRLLLQYGSMRLVYTNTIYYPKPSGDWIRRDKGDIVLKDKSGNIILPWASENSKDRYKDLNSVPMRWEWFSKKKNVDNVNENLIDELSKIANKRGFHLSPAYFDDNNNPLYKMRGAPTNMKQKTMKYLNSIKNNLEKYFGEEGLDVPIIKKNRDELNTLINNYTKSVEARDKGLAENHIRKAVREMLAVKLSK